MKKFLILILTFGLILVNTISSQEIDQVELDLFIKKVTQDIKLEYFELNSKEQKLFIDYLNISNKFFKGSIIIRNETVHEIWKTISGLKNIKDIMDKNPNFEKINSIYGSSIESILAYAKSLTSYNKIINFNNFIINELKELKYPILSKL